MVPESKAEVMSLLGRECALREKGFFIQITSKSNSRTLRPQPPSPSVLQVHLLMPLAVGPLSLGQLRAQIPRLYMQARGVPLVGVCALCFSNEIGELRPFRNI